MYFKSEFSLSLIFVVSVAVLIASTGCEKDDNGDDQNGQNGGKEEIDFEIDYGNVTDIDGNDYKTIVIGSQEWMVENLRVSRYNNGDSIEGGLTDSEWSNATEGAYAFWDNDTSMLQAYGKFYNWYAVDDSREICPSGWRVPGQYDVEQLTEYLINTYQEISSSNVGNYLKSCRQQGSPLGGDCDTQDHPVWNGHSDHYGTNDFGFSAYPAGIREANGNYLGVGYTGLFWTANEFSGSESVGFGLFHDSGSLDLGSDVFNAGFCIRCIKE